MRNMLNSSHVHARVGGFRSLLQLGQKIFSFLKQGHISHGLLTERYTLAHDYWRIWVWKLARRELLRVKLWEGLQIVESESFKLRGYDSV